MITKHEGFPENHMFFDFHFQILTAESEAQIWFDKHSRDSCFSRMWDIIDELRHEEGGVTVNRKINGIWRPCNDWRKLTH